MIRLSPTAPSVQPGPLRRVGPSRVRRLRPIDRQRGRWLRYSVSASDRRPIPRIHGVLRTIYPKTGMRVDSWISPRLEVHIYQITDDAMMKANRPDGTGWDWCWADWQRTWMNNTPQRYAYRCLPLTIVNQTGWWIKNPVGFTATWRGGTAPGTIDFQFDSSSEVWSQLDQQPVRRGHHHLEHAVPLPHQAAGLAPAGLRPRQSLQGQRPSAHRLDRERLDQHVVHDELQDDDPQLPRPLRRGRAALPGDPPGEQRLRRPGDGQRSRSRDSPTIPSCSAPTMNGTSAGGSSTSRSARARSGRMAGSGTTSRAAMPSAARPRRTT